MKIKYKNISFITVIILAIIFYECSSFDNKETFFSSVKKGKELPINYWNLEQYSSSIINSQKELELDSTVYLNNPFSPDSWYSFEMTNSDTAKVNLFHNNLNTNIFSDFLKTGEYFIDFKKFNVPQGFYYLQFINSNDTIVKRIFIGKEMNLLEK